MENRAMDLELGVSPVSNNHASSQTTSSISYIPPTLQSDVDDMIREMLAMKGDHDYETPFIQMNYIVWTLMPAVLMAQESSIGELVPLVEANEIFNTKLANMQKHFGDWSKEVEVEQPDGSKLTSTGEAEFFKDLGEFETYLGTDEGKAYGVHDEMSESVTRIYAGMDSVKDDKLTKNENIAWNAVQAPTGLVYVDDSETKQQLANDPGPNDTSGMYFLNSTTKFQPVLDQTNKEMVVLQGLNTSVSQKVEMELKYKIEFYNSYITSTGSMEDALSKQKNASIKRLR
jgi:hypothetical protein